MKKRKHFNTINKQLRHKNEGKSKQIYTDGKEGYRPNEEPIYCKTFGCGKRLKPTEILYGEYCFNCSAVRNQKERERLKLCKLNATYIVKKFRWDSVLNRWDAVREIEITVAKFCEYVHGEDFNNDSSQTYYRYDLYVDSANADIIYSYNPNLYD